MLMTPIPASPGLVSSSTDCKCLEPAEYLNQRTHRSWISSRVQVISPPMPRSGALRILSRNRRAAASHSGSLSIILFIA